MPLRYPAERILIRCPNWIGDMIAATAALRCMRANYPRAHIALLLKAYVRPVIAHAPWADEVIEVDPRGGPSGSSRRSGGCGERLRMTWRCC